MSPGSPGGQALFTGPSLAQGAGVPYSGNCQASGLQCRSGCHEPRGPACHGSRVQGLNKRLAREQRWPVSAGRAVASVQALGVLAGRGRVPQAARWSCPEPANGDPPPPPLNKAPLARTPEQVYCVSTPRQQGAQEDSDSTQAGQLVGEPELCLPGCRWSFRLRAWSPPGGPWLGQWAEPCGAWQ